MARETPSNELSRMRRGPAILPLAAVVVPLLVLNLAAGVSAKFLAAALPALTAAVVPALIMGACYAGRLGLWLYAGRRWQLSFLYPIMSLNYVAAALLGRALFNEVLTAQRWVGLLVLLAGVVMCATSPHRDETGGEPA